MRPILVTGGAGFLGSHVVEELRRRLPDVPLVVPRSGRRSVGLGVAGVAELQVDLRDRSAVTRLFREVRPGAVIHLAGRVGGIGEAVRRPATMFYDNLLMGVHVIDEASVAGCTKVVVVGSVCSYPRDTPVPFHEADLWSGYPEETHAPYGIAKRTLLTMADAYRKEHGTHVVSLILSNLYGPRDNFDPESSHVIPAIVRKFVEATWPPGARREAGIVGDARVIVLWGDGKATREFLYVEDAARGICDAFDRYDGIQPVNLGVGREVSIADVAGILRGVTGYSGLIEWDRSLPSGQPRRCVDTSRALKLLGFEATTSLGEGLEKTVAWYRMESSWRSRG